MKTLYIERSTGECRNGEWVSKLDLDGVERIVVGTGPGSFAGIRSALAFAQGYSIGTGCEVLGMPSACALAKESGLLAVVGDARRDKFWVALFDGMRLLKPIFQTMADDLAVQVPEDARVVTPDEERIGLKLGEIFGARYIGGEKPAPEGLERFAEANPSILEKEPLPIYLNPAVRP